MSTERPPDIQIMLNGNGMSSSIEIDGALRTDVIAVVISQEVGDLPMIELITLIDPHSGLEGAEELLISSASIAAYRVPPGE